MDGVATQVSPHRRAYGGAAVTLVQTRRLTFSLNSRPSGTETDSRIRLRLVQNASKEKQSTYDPLEGSTKSQFQVFFLNKVVWNASCWGNPLPCYSTAGRGDLHDALAHARRTRPLFFSEHNFLLDTKKRTETINDESSQHRKQQSIQIIQEIQPGNKQENKANIDFSSFFFLSKHAARLLRARFLSQKATFYFISF